MGSKGAVSARLVRNFFWSLKHDGIRTTARRVLKTLKYGPNLTVSEVIENQELKYEEGDYGHYVKSIEMNHMARFQEEKLDFVEIAKTPYVREAEDTKVIAWYLPQYYQMEVNNRYHGQGFTEWTNSSQAIPLFAEHYQPHIPYDVGYYDLTNIDTLKRQAELAKMYGVYGFCFHWYWFSGERTMEVPGELLLRHKDIDLKFCFNWATENWTSAWDGGTKEVIFEQKLKDGDERRFMDDILPYMKDKRYICIDGRPVLSIYRVDMFLQKRFLKFVSLIRSYAKEAGFPDLYLLITDRAFSGDVKEWGADALAEFPPSAVWSECERYQPKGYVNPNFKGDIFDIRSFVSQKKYLKQTASGKVFRSALVSFDNTARRATTGCQILMGTDPVHFKMWIKGIIEESRRLHQGDERIVFVNSWNEWAEGSHLEPDMKYGYAYLQAVKEALEETREIRYHIVEEIWKEKKRRSISTIRFYVHCIESMGDVIACEPVARYLKSMDSEAEVCWIIKPGYTDLVKYNPYIDKYIEAACLSDAIDICRAAETEENNIIVDCHYDGRICEKTHRVHTNKNNPMVNEGTYFAYGTLLQSFCLSAGLPLLEEAPRFYFAPDVSVSVNLPKPYVVFHCRSAESCKDWTDNKWNILAYKIMEEGYYIAEVGLEPVVWSRNPKYRDCTDIHDLQQIAAIIKEADCLFGIDSGFAHMANSLNTYGILIFGKYKSFDYPAVYSGHYQDGTNAAILYADRAPAAAVEVEKVFEAFLDHIQKTDVGCSAADTAVGESTLVAKEDFIGCIDTYIPYTKTVLDLGGAYGNITYSQYGDDMQILNLFCQIGFQQPSYLDIGAHHPYVMSNTAALYDAGSRGINVEADRDLLLAFVMEREEDQNIHAVVSAQAASEIFYRLEKAPGCSTLLKKRAEDFITKMPQHGPLKAQKVHTTTMDEIVTKYGRDGSYPDFLNLNTGGNEYEVLESSTLLYSNGPAVIDVEVDGRDHERFRKMLAGNGYFFYIRLGVNEIYVREKYRERIVW